jgi:hypothetical protein
MTGAGAPAWARAGLAQAAKAQITTFLIRFFLRMLPEL